MKCAFGCSVKKLHHSAHYVVSGCKQLRLTTIDWRQQDFDTDSDKCWYNWNIDMRELQIYPLTLNPLTWKIWWAPNNAGKWQMGFNSMFKVLKTLGKEIWVYKITCCWRLCWTEVKELVFFYEPSGNRCLQPPPSPVGLHYGR